LFVPSFVCSFICLFVCIFIHLLVSLFIRLFVSICLYLGLFVCLYLSVSRSIYFICDILFVNASTGPPKMVTAPNNTQVILNGTAVLDCVLAVTNIPTKISWYKKFARDPTLISIDKLDNRYLVLSNMSLKIDKVKTSDEAYYSCQAENPLGSVNGTAFLKVLSKYHTISYHIVSHHITSHHITSHHITSHHITSHHITSHHITSHHITSHHITSHHIVSYSFLAMTRLHFTKFKMMPSFFYFYFSFLRYIYYRFRRSATVEAKSLV